AILDTLRARVEAEADPYQRQLALLLLLNRSAGSLGLPNEFGLRYRGFTPMPAAYVDEILATIPPASPLWTVRPNLVGWLVEQADLSEAAYAYAQRVVEEHYAEAVVEDVLYDLVRIAYAR